MPWTTIAVELDLSRFLNSELTLDAVGEKELIRQIITPLFNPNKARWSVGDDCALVEPAPGKSLLLSTDRVPSDLNAFRLGILDCRGLGRYLARLNLSDIAASGGEPCGLLLNLGLPRKLPLRDLVLLLLGALEVATSHGCGILGGDLSDASELSISATAIGQIERSRALSRQTAKVGDLVFVSRPLGLTPAAFRYYEHSEILRGQLHPDAVNSLERQFTDVGPMFSLAAKLVASGRCSSCMDNTDGIGQSLFELAENSNVAIVIDPGKLSIPQVVRDVAAITGQDPLRLAFAPGADFSLVGTITPNLYGDIPSEISIIGHVQPGRGVHLMSGSDLQPLIIEGWNYYSAQVKAD